jgi:hypothetical protein
MGEAFLDRWSITHLIWGFLFGRTAWLTPLQWLALHTAYEVWENSGADSVVKVILKHEKDSWPNFLGDTMSAMAGYGIGMGDSE